MLETPHHASGVVPERTRRIVLNRRSCQIHCRHFCVCMYVCRMYVYSSEVMPSFDCSVLHGKLFLAVKVWFRDETTSDVEASRNKSDVQAWKQEAKQQGKEVGDGGRGSDTSDLSASNLSESCFVMQKFSSLKQPNIEYHHNTIHVAQFTQRVWFSHLIYVPLTMKRQKASH